MKSWGLDRAEGNDIGAYVDDVLAQIPAVGSRLYYHHNHLYTVGALTDSAGVVKERYAYSAYGGRQTVVDDPAVKNDIAFTGRRLDNETGPHYFRARYFDAELGRFVGRDPLGYVDLPSLYAPKFVPNQLDPSGRLCCEDARARMGADGVVVQEGVDPVYLYYDCLCPGGTTQVDDSFCDGEGAEGGGAGPQPPGDGPKKPPRPWPDPPGGDIPIPPGITPLPPPPPANEGCPANTTCARRMQIVKGLHRYYVVDNGCSTSDQGCHCSIFLDPVGRRIETRCSRTPGPTEIFYDPKNNQYSDNNPGGG